VVAQGCPLERKRFVCREWAFARLAHCLESRAASKTCGALVVGGPGTGKTALCCEAVWPSAGPAARQQRALHRRLLAYHFCQSHDATTLSVAEFIRSLVRQLQAAAPNAAPDAPASPPAALPTQGLSPAAAAAYAERVRSDPEIQVS
jgi:predicted ATPase